MTTIQRMRSDIATMDRRDTADQTMKDNRNRNDEMTQERRSKADKTMGENRLKNDELTSNRRDIKDGNPSAALTVFLVILAVLAIGTLFVII